MVHTAEEGGFWVEVPALPGCYSQGESVEESLRNVTEAIELYLEVLRDVPKDAEVDVGAIRESPLPGTYC